MERVVTRADLVSSQTPPPASPEPDVLEKWRGHDSFEYVTSKVQSKGQNAEEPYDQEDDQLDFQLFAAPKTEPKDATHKIRLRSPSFDPEKVGFTQPHRNPDYYFTYQPSPEAETKLNTAALTGSQVLTLSTTPQPGLAYPWKILHLPLSALSPSARLASTSRFPKLVDDTPAKKRTRPGKKYRIKLRQKAAAKRAATEARKVMEEEREAAEREKRTRRNREKKVKRKAKEKMAKKGGEAGGEGEDGVGEGKGRGGDAEPAD